MSTTVIKNGKDISNTDEGKTIVEKAKESLRVKLPQLFEHIFGNFYNKPKDTKSEKKPAEKKEENKKEEPKKDDAKEKIDEKDAKIAELEKKVEELSAKLEVKKLEKIEELSAKLEVKKLEDQKKDVKEIKEPKKDVEIIEEPKQVPEKKLEAPVPDEYEDDKETIDTPETLDSEKQSFDKQPIQEQQGQDILDKKQIQEKQTAKQLITHGKELLEQKVADTVNDAAEESKETINKIGKEASKLLK